MSDQSIKYLRVWGCFMAVQELAVAGREGGGCAARQAAGPAADGLQARHVRPATDAVRCVTVDAGTLIPTRASPPRVTACLNTTPT